jgi:hypothetical protein
MNLKGEQASLAAWTSRVGLAALVLLLVCGCSSFNRDWKAAAAPPPPPTALDGRWLGVWRSEASGHNGQLRCLVTLEPNQQYQARFHAKYRKILGFGYTVPLQVTITNGQFWFRGEGDLGWYGVYHCEGRVNGTNFFSSYHCEGDHGTFEMGRPNPKQ